MRFGPLLCAAIMASLSVAGCMGQGADVTTIQASGLHGDGAPQGLAAPVFAVGDWWNYTSPAGVFSYVVSGETSSDYIMDTDSLSVAFFNTQSDVSTLGPIRKDDLAGSQGEQRVRFFEWPLTDGRNWTTKWDGLDIAIVAKQAGVERFTFTASRPDGTTYATYTYDNKTRWFTELDFRDEIGNPGFAIKLAASGKDFPGLLRRWTVTSILDLQTNGSAVAENSNFQVPDDATDIHIRYSFACAAGPFNVAIGPLGAGAPQTGHQKNGFCNDPPVTVAVPALAGSWGISITSVAPAVAFAKVLVRTLVSFPPGSAPTST